MVEDQNSIARAGTGAPADVHDILELAFLDLINAGKVDAEAVVASIESAMAELDTLRTPAVVRQMAVLVNSLAAAKSRT